MSTVAFGEHFICYDLLMCLMFLYKYFLQFLEGNFALFCSYTLGFRNDFQNILLVIMVSIIKGAAF